MSKFTIGKFIIPNGFFSKRLGLNPKSKKIYMVVVVVVK